MMKTTGSVQEKNGRFYFVVNLYDANGKRKIKWISTGLTVRGNKRKAESMLREVLLHYDETGELPTGRGGAYEKVDAKTAKPLPHHLQPVSKSEIDRCQKKLCIRVMPTVSCFGITRMS